VLAIRQTEEKICNDYQLNHSTRTHLLAQLRNIEDAFKKRPTRQELG
jgi:hypothetical protein